ARPHGRRPARVRTESASTRGDRVRRRAIRRHWRAAMRTAPGRPHLAPPPRPGDCRSHFPPPLLEHKPSDWDTHADSAGQQRDDPILIGGDTRELGRLTPGPAAHTVHVVRRVRFGHATEDSWSISWFEKD